jgi:hypothetical protein
MAVKIQSTTNYEMFEVCAFNRDVNKLDNIKDSMRQHGFIPAYPLHCKLGDKGKLIVKAGHHRLQSAKQLGLPVFYVVTEDSASVHELEKASRAWSYRDFVESHARAGSASHIAVSDYAERTGISLKQATSMLGGESASSGNLQHKVKDGSFVLKDKSHAELVGAIVVAVKQAGVAWATNANFVSAISSACWLDEFNPDVFIHRVATNLHLMIKQATQSQFLDLIDKVYNHSAKSKIALAFLAKQAAANRNVVTRNKKK